MDGKGNRTEYTYDGLNRKTNALHGAGSATTRQRPYAYDAINMVSDIGTAYEYNNRNWLTKHSDTLTQTDAVSYNYTYDAVGRILSVNDVSYSYDSLGRILSETNGGYTHTYTYDKSGNRISSRFGVDDNDSFTHALTSRYDSNNRLTSLRDNNGRVVKYGYDLNGNPVFQSYPNGVAIKRTYDSLNRLGTITAKKSDGSLLMYGEYKYDAAGNVRYICQVCDEKSYVVSIEYDAFDRIVTEYPIGNDDNLNPFIHRYTYDSAGNTLMYMIEQDGFPWDGRAYSYNSLNQMSTSNFYPGIPGNYTYDAMGNFISHHEIYSEEYENTTDPLKYDGFGRYVGNSSAKHVYDYRGRLISTINLLNGKYTYKGTYSGGTSVIDESGANKTYLYRGLDMGGGVGGINYACKSDGSGLNYKHYNLRGDVIVTSNSEGNVLSQIQYTAYGSRRNTYGSEPIDRYRSNTKLKDLYINEGHRWRSDTETGFLSPDPLEYIDGLNCYSYCNNNPWGRWDPEGLFGWGDAGSLGLDFIPVVSTGKGILEFATGQDAVTGDSIPRWVSAMGMAGSFVPGGKAAAKLGIKALTKGVVKNTVAKTGRLASTAEKAADAAKAVGETAEVANAGSKTATTTVNPQNLLSRQGPSEMTGSKVKRLTSDMKQNGYDSTHPIEVANVDGRKIILDGHHRAAAAVKAGLKDVPIKETAVTPKQAAKLLDEVAEAAAERSQKKQ